MCCGMADLQCLTLKLNRQVMWHWASHMCPTAIVIHHHNQIMYHVQYVCIVIIVKLYISHF